MFRYRRALMFQLLAVVLVWQLLTMLGGPADAAALPQEARALGEMVRLSGHVLPALQGATPVSPTPGAEADPLTLTVVLKRTDQAGFDRYLREVYDPHAPAFRHFLSQGEMTERFGPTPKAYNDVLTYLQRHGFTLVQGSANHLTLTVRGTRAQAERAFDVHIRDFDVAGRHFSANVEEPAIPQHLGTHVQAVGGLSDLAQPRAADSLIDALYHSFRAGEGAAFRILSAINGPGGLGAAAAEDAELAAFVRWAGGAERLLIAVQAALAMASPPKPSK